jgi:hypothetical protein
LRTAPAQKPVVSTTCTRLALSRSSSLTLRIQKDSPGAEHESNWLPAPDGPIYLVMRLYWPKAAALEGAWKPPAVQRAP